jgi:hypothetical protein
MNTKAPVSYVALLRTPGGLLQKATICADTFTQAHFTVRELWPGLRIVRIIQDGEW